MKIKTKVVISFCIIMFVPLVLAGLALAGFNAFQTKVIEQKFGIRQAQMYTLTNSIELMSSYTKVDFEEIEQSLHQDVRMIEDPAYLDQINADLTEKMSYLVVRREDEIVYNGGSGNDNVLQSLAEYGSTDSKTHKGAYLDNDADALVKQIDFEYSDGSRGSVFVIMVAKNMMSNYKRVILYLLIAIVMILTFTGLVLTAWVYRSIITPIRKLQAAAENIKEGNLDFTVEISGDDELGELCLTFEEMRQRLKDNAEEKLQNEKENRALISNIAHDLKTPITAVKGYSEGIIDGVANTPEKVEKYVQTIYNKANEMDTLINELTLYSKIDTNRIPYNYAKINVEEYFADCIADIGLDLEAKGIGLAYYNYVPADTLVIADSEQLRRVINNIIGNSIKYMDKQHGFVNIRIKDVGDFIQVEIEDNGRGIAQKDLPYIFDRFYRADASRNSATGGSGIGLSIVKKIIEDHGGKIWATSRENNGTVMYFVIRKYQEVPNE